MKATTIVWQDELEFYFVCEGHRYGFEQWTGSSRFRTRREWRRQQELAYTALEEGERCQFCVYCQFGGCQRDATKTFRSSEANGESTEEHFCDEHAAGIISV